jgi:ketosteroid isomerase-like protein
VQENVEVTRRAFEAFDRRDVDGVLALCDPEVEFHAVTGELAAGGEPYRGHEGIRRYFADAERVWEELRMTPRDFRAVGDHVVVLGRVYARGGGRIVDSPTGWVWRIRDGLLVWGRVYANPEDALAAVE